MHGVSHTHSRNSPTFSLMDSSDRYLNTPPRAELHTQITYRNSLLPQITCYRQFLAYLVRLPLVVTVLLQSSHVLVSSRSRLSLSHCIVHNQHKSIRSSIAINSIRKSILNHICTAPPCPNAPASAVLTASLHRTCGFTHRIMPHYRHHSFKCLRAIHIR